MREYKNVIVAYSIMILLIIFLYKSNTPKSINELQKIVESGASFIPFSMDTVMLHHFKPKV